MRRIFVDDAVANGEWLIAGDEHKHLFVLRVRAGENLEVCCGDGFVYRCEIARVSKEQTLLKVVEKRVDVSEAELACDLFLGILKGEHMEIAVQKCTELGIHSITPLLTENTVKTDINAMRLQKITLEAAKQCGRGRVPKISIPQKIASVYDVLRGYDIVVFPYEKAEENDLFAFLSGQSLERGKWFSARSAQSGESEVEMPRVAIVIGPEGGFSSGEADALAAITTPITLGRRILRADTACIAATTAVMLVLGQMKF